MFFFFFNDTATTEIYTLSLHDALPISPELAARDDPAKERNGGPHALDHALVEGIRHPLHRPLSRGPVGDQLEEQRVVVHGHCAPDLDSGLDPDSFPGR